ncbi:MAG: hypothetical protein HC803_07835 [Saprospiraceae bacterium]|nr:hypothetical protein [Saprospiraceae bacterium]
MNGLRHTLPQRRKVKFPTLTNLYTHTSIKKRIFVKIIQQTKHINTIVFLIVYFILIKNLIKALVYILSFLVLVSTNGLTINQHFCSGQLVKAALFYKAEKCKHEVKPMTCCEKKAAAKNLAHCNLNKTKKCCDEKVVIVKVDNEAQPLYVDFQLNTPIFIAIIPIQNLMFQSSLEFFTPPYFNYKPPLILEDELEILGGAFLC